MVLIVAGSVNTADKRAVVCEFHLRIIDEGLTLLEVLRRAVMDMCRPLVTVADQEAVSQRIAAEDIVHLPFCTGCILRRCIITCDRKRTHLKCAVISCCAPAVAVVFACRNAACILNLENQLILEGIILRRLVHQCGIALPDLIP